MIDRPKYVHVVRFVIDTGFINVSCGDHTINQLECHLHACSQLHRAYETYQIKIST